MAGLMALQNARDSVPPERAGWNFRAREQGGENPRMSVLNGDMKRKAILNDPGVSEKNALAA